MQTIEVIRGICNKIIVSIWNQSGLYHVAARTNRVQARVQVKSSRARSVNATDAARGMEITWFRRFFLPPTGRAPWFVDDRATPNTNSPADDEALRLWLKIDR